MTGETYLALIVAASNDKDRESLGWKKTGMDKFKGHHVTVMELGP
jgi:hypothetical protein